MVGQAGREVADAARLEGRFTAAETGLICAGLTELMVTCGFGWASSAVRSRATVKTDGLPFVADGQCPMPTVGSSPPTSGRTLAAGGTEGSCHYRKIAGRRHSATERSFRTALPATIAIHVGQHVAGTPSCARMSSARASHSHAQPCRSSFPRSHIATKGLTLAQRPFPGLLRFPS